MTEQKQDKNTTGHDPNREHMTLSALWNLWMDNLKSWRQYREEHADLFTLNIQAGFRRIGGWLGRVRRSARISGFPNRSWLRRSCFFFCAAA